VFDPDEISEYNFMRFHEISCKVAFWAEKVPILRKREGTNRLEALPGTQTGEWIANHHKFSHILSTQFKMKAVE